MIKIIRKRRKLDSAIALLCFFIYCVLGVFINSYIVENNNVRLLVNALRFLLIAFLLYDSINKTITRKRKLSPSFFIIFILSILVFIFSRNYQLIFLFIFILWVSNYDFREIIKIAVNAHFLAIIIVILLALLGIIKNIEFTRYMQTQVRYSLGFIAPAIASGYLLHMLMAEIVLYKFKLPLSKYITYISMNIILFLLTDTRFETIIIFALLFISFALSYIKHKKVMRYIKKHVVLKNMLIISPIFFFMINCVLLVGYKNNISFFVNLANVMSSRVQYTISAIDLSGFSLFGVNIDFKAFDIVLDSSYFKVLLEYGIVGFILLMICYMNLIKISIKNMNLALFIIIFVILLENIFSPFALDYNYNIIILFSINFYANRRKIYYEKINWNYSCNIQ